MKLQKVTTVAEVIVDLVEEHQPDVIIMDINMPAVSSWLLKKLCRSKSDAKVIILSIHDDGTYVTHALQNRCTRLSAKKKWMRMR